MAEHDQTIQIAVSGGSCVGSSVEIEYLGLDKLRLDAMRRSASDLIAAMFNTSLSAAHCDCVWPLIDAVWPARSTNAYRDFPNDQITLTLVPLSRIGQMEGKSGSLVLIGCFRDSQNNEIPPSHPVVVKTAPTSTGKLQDEYGNAWRIRPFTYEYKDVFSIPFHPGSVVIASENQPRIIDFGWAQDDAHIGKDFVLMECNLIAKIDVT